MGMQIGGYTGFGTTSSDISKAIKISGSDNVSASEIKNLKRSGEIQCHTCASREYKDGSDEGNVSYKSPAVISPESSRAKVSSHEHEHVSNAYKKASNGNGKVLNSSVSYKMGVCPECGKSYTAGGLTTTAIKYDESNPYMKNLKSFNQNAMVGNNIDYSV